MWTHESEIKVQVGENTEAPEHFNMQQSGEPHGWTAYPGPSTHGRKVTGPQGMEEIRQPAFTLLLSSVKWIRNHPRTVNVGSYHWILWTLSKVQ